MRKADWKSALVWIAAFILTLAVMGWITRQESDRQLEQDAGQSAKRWSLLFTQTVSDLDTVFTTGRLTPAAREHLLRLRKVNDVFDFRLFDPSGRLLLMAEDLEKPELPVYDSIRNGIGDQALDGSKASIRKQVLGGTSHIALQREPWSGGPTVYGEVYLPVLSGGKPLGVVEVHVDQTQRAANAAQGLTRIAVIVTMLLLGIGSVATYQYVVRLRKQRKAEDKVRYLAHHDALSGAMNRASFHEALRRTAGRKSQKGTAFSLLRIDLDRFKEVNEAVGHTLGDEVLRLTTQRLKSCLREDDKVARLGGDEFAILLIGEASQKTVSPFAKRITDALAAPIDLSGHKVRCGGTIGIAMYGPDGTDPDYLMSKADQALYRAKADGRGTFAFYDDTLDRQMQSKRELTRDLRQAIGSDQLIVFYQPQYGNDGDLLVGY